MSSSSNAPSDSSFQVPKRLTGKYDLLKQFDPSEAYKAYLSRRKQTSSSYTNLIGHIPGKHAEKSKDGSFWKLLFINDQPIQIPKSEQLKPQLERAFKLKTDIVVPEFDPSIFTEPARQVQAPKLKFTFKK